MTELVVIGAGLAGLIAATRAAQAGHQVKIVAKGFGATHWHAGSIDLLGYFPNETIAIQRPLDAMRDVARVQPQHPYALLSDAQITDALKNFLALTREIGLPYVGAIQDGDNLWLPSPVGAARPTFLAPHAQRAGDLTRAEPMLIVGLRGMRDFYPELIAENLGKQGHPARAAFLPLDLITDRRDITTVQLAYALDDPARRARLASELKKLAQAGERIGVIGPNSVPGIRLTNALCNHLRQLGARVDVNMDVIAFRAEGDRVLWIESEASGRPLKHRAEKFLLATGGILGGGINTDHTGKIRETIFDMPLVAPRDRGQWFRARFFDPAGHPIFRAGIPVNREFQPVDANGARVFANVWAAGSTLAHCDPILERALEGIAITTGSAAACFAGQK
ncbi:MAG: anaerobic glycerol-3-phosphate dehydrogenase subunit B [Chloroflexi bacterium]|nr:anaerobic glycerol-3-phosphate dehydrogenase subunit B [Chloroflexota bacterium]